MCIFVLHNPIMIQYFYSQFKGGIPLNGIAIRPHSADREIIPGVKVRAIPGWTRTSTADILALPERINVHGMPVHHLQSTEYPPFYGNDPYKPALTEQTRYHRTTWMDTIYDGNLRDLFTQKELDHIFYNGLPMSDIDFRVGDVLIHREPEGMVLYDSAWGDGCITGEHIVASCRPNANSPDGLEFSMFPGFVLLEDLYTKPTATSVRFTPERKQGLGLIRGICNYTRKSGLKEGDMVIMEMRKEDHLYKDISIPFVVNGKTYRMIDLTFIKGLYEGDTTKFGTQEI